MEIKVEQLKSGDVFLLDGYKFVVDSIVEDGVNIFGDPLFLLNIRPYDTEAAKSYTARLYGTTSRWQGYLRLQKAMVA